MSSEKLTDMVLWYVCLLFSLSVHEAAHAATAERCGDSTARMLGRVTLNPIAHIDPIGTVVMPLLMMVTGLPYLFGWAKPVPFNPRHLRNIRRDPVLIAVAGPASNLLLVLAAICVTRVAFTVLGVGAVVNTLFFMFAETMIVLNLILFVFNLIPIPPLDGGHVLYYFLPENGRRAVDQAGPIGILLALFVMNRYLAAPLDYLGASALSMLFWGYGV